MVRRSQLLHPAHQPAPLRPAATMLLLRDSSMGLEVLMTRRSAQASFVPGAFVFPGGGIDAADAQLPAATVRHRTSQPDPLRASAVAAIRESWEELGILLARQTNGDWVNDQDLAALDRHQPLATTCTHLGLTLAADELHLLAHWITDRDLPKRFDVHFWVARMPDGQTPVADETEQFEPVWVHPAEALQRHAAGEFFMIFPTVRTLERLQHFATVDAVLQQCQQSEAPLWSSCARAGWLAGKEMRFMEHEPAYGELALTCPDGQLAHHLDWQHDHPVALLKNVQRLTAPNPGYMTGPGTNSYLVGEPGAGFIAIDPGPGDHGHLERLWRAAGGDIRAIVCTHSHPDHSTGAAYLQSLCQQAPHGRPPILGLTSGPHAQQHSLFAPDRELADAETLTLHSPDGHTRHTLRALHTPGHAANHVCLVLEEDGLLFSGDHILNGSTTVIDPPDGNMDAYLQSLDRLQQACATFDIEFILPAHGHVLGHAPAAIAHLKNHRLQREAKVARAMQHLPQGTPDDWVWLAYDDVDERLWPVAKRSMQAHVERIQSLGGFNV